MAVKECILPVRVEGKSGELVHPNLFRVSRKNKLLINKRYKFISTEFIEDVPSRDDISIINSVDQSLLNKDKDDHNQFEISELSHESVRPAAAEGEGWYGVFSFTDGFGICIEYNTGAKISV
jgi:hypothetical protein